MSLDINFTYKIDSHGDLDIDYVDISNTWHYNRVDSHLNITHNLGDMASYVKSELFPSLTLYDVLWRPYRIYKIEEDTDEAYSFMPIAKDLKEFLKILTDELVNNQEKYEKYNPDNGWGHYEGLVRFCQKYLRCIERYPNAHIEVSR